MDADFWRQRWADNLIGFHQREINPFLKQYWDKLDLTGDAGVFVPLCGKSLDILWLAERSRVLGVELSDQAVNGFFAENQLAARRTREGAFEVSEAGNIRLLCGDFFDLHPSQLAGVRAVYDRAALIALPAEMRIAYADQLNRLLPAGVSMLLVTMAYDQSQMDGPPFAVLEEEVRELFSGTWHIARIHVDDVLASEPKFRERGLTLLEEQVYLLTKQ